jgi:putative DNA primase/helicase
VALIADARLSDRSDKAVIVERLLSISGEDAQTIDRKHLSSWTGTLATRFVLISNELPRLADASGALSSRMVLLRFVRTFFGSEDTTLLGRLLAERTAILRWAVDGWARLRERGRFVQPASGRELLDDLDELSSPVSSFVADRCTVGPDCSVAIADLFEAWKGWCKEKGRDHPGDVAGFGRNLRAVLPHIKTSQPRQGRLRARIYSGIDLRSDWPVTSAASSGGPLPSGHVLSWLSAYLLSGAAHIDRIVADAAQEGIDRSTLERARAALEIQKFNDGGGEHWKFAS